MLKRGIYIYRSSRDISFIEICNTIWESNYIYISNTYGGMHTYYTSIGDVLGGPVVKTLPSNEGDAGLIPGQGAK